MELGISADASMEKRILGRCDSVWCGRGWGSRDGGARWATDGGVDFGLAGSSKLTTSSSPTSQSNFARSGHRRRLAKSVTTEEKCGLSGQGYPLIGPTHHCSEPAMPFDFSLPAMVDPRWHCDGGEVEVSSKSHADAMLRWSGGCWSAAAFEQHRSGKLAPREESCFLTDGLARLLAATGSLLESCRGRG